METLEQTIFKLEMACKEMSRKQMEYKDSAAFREFATSRITDLRNFKSYVHGLGENTSISNVITFLREQGASKNVICMVENPEKHFRETEKLKALMMFGY